MSQEVKVLTEDPTGTADLSSWEYMDSGPTVMESAWDKPPLLNYASPRTGIHSLTPSTRLWEKLYLVGVSPGCCWWVRVGRVRLLLSATW